MRPTEEQDRLEKEQAEEIIAKAPPMEGVESITVELADDFDGDPAMWLVFHLRPDLVADGRWHQQFSKYNHDLDMRIIHSGLTRFPYFRLRRAA